MNSLASVIASERSERSNLLKRLPRRLQESVRLLQPRFSTVVLGILTPILFLLFTISQADAVSPQVCHQDNCVSVEVVSKDADMERGLMFRTGLGPGKGMLFVFSFDDKEQFWMKNMHFNLDMLWISHDGHIVYLGKNIPACTADPCPVYTPDKAARYVLEINSGYTSSHHWNIGDKLEFKGVL